MRERGDVVVYACPARHALCANVLIAELPGEQDAAAGIRYIYSPLSSIRALCTLGFAPRVFHRDFRARARERKSVQERNARWLLNVV